MRRLPRADRCVNNAPWPWWTGFLISRWRLTRCAACGHEQAFDADWFEWWGRGEELCPSCGVDCTAEDTTQISLKQRMSARPCPAELTPDQRSAGPVPERFRLRRCHDRGRRGVAVVSAPLRRLHHQVGCRDLAGQPYDYQDSWQPTSMMGSTAEDALDTACGLYLGDPTAWT